MADTADTADTDAQPEPRSHKSKSHKLKKGKKSTSAIVLFRARMKREKREAEWEAELKKTQKEIGVGTGRGFSTKAIWETMHRMGYESASLERHLRAEHERLGGLMARQRLLEQDVLREEQKVEAYETALRSIPDQATPARDMAWIKAHPAMSILDRQEDKTKSVIVTADDILCPPHGPAPSKVAVNALQHWVNRPGEFYKQVLQEQKKDKDDSEEAAAREQDMGLAAVEELLKTVMGSPKDAPDSLSPTDVPDTPDTPDAPDAPTEKETELCISESALKPPEPKTEPSREESQEAEQTSKPQPEQPQEPPGEESYLDPDLGWPGWPLD